VPLHKLFAHKTVNVSKCVTQTKFKWKLLTVDAVPKMFSPGFTMDPLRITSSHFHNVKHERYIFNSLLKLSYFLNFCFLF